MSAPTAWTSREVHFILVPSTETEVFDALMDRLADDFYGTPAWVRRFFEPAICSVNLTVKVCGFPWWMPAGAARHMVAKRALAVGAGGDARYIVERTVLS